MRAKKYSKLNAFCQSGMMMMMMMTGSTGRSEQFMSHFLNALHFDAAPQQNSLLKLIMKACLPSKWFLFVLFACEGVFPRH